jgi:hypothetical protein
MKNLERGVIIERAETGDEGTRVGRAGPLDLTEPSMYNHATALTIRPETGRTSRSQSPDEAGWSI